MAEEQYKQYRKHVFVCTNQKPEGKPCCGDERGLALMESLRNMVKEQGLQKEIRVQKSGCLDCCSQGPAMVVYPEGVFYGGVQPEDLGQIFEEHLLADQVVARLRI